MEEILPKIAGNFALLKLNYNPLGGFFTLVSNWSCVGIAAGQPH
ncbi:hypothetical protein [Sinorhizobium mexicanum]|nr:hypothetical protein [Sinorhizobium mexicanum]MBP1885354.1 hypothetical protein [Sinorhizobium mexicanum]